MEASSVRGASIIPNAVAASLRRHLADLSCLEKRSNVNSIVPCVRKISCAFGSRVTPFLELILQNLRLTLHPPRCARVQ